MKILSIIVSFTLIIMAIDNYRLKQEIRTLNMLIGFDWDIINQREKLLDENNIKYDDYAYTKE